MVNTVIQPIVAALLHRPAPTADEQRADTGDACEQRSDAGHPARAAAVAAGSRGIGINRREARKVTTDTEPVSAAMAGVRAP
jgi:hypothetical protein